MTRLRRILERNSNFIEIIFKIELMQMSFKTIFMFKTVFACPFAACLILMYKSRNLLQNKKLNTFSENRITE